jgi:hypothetical protein
MIRLIAWLIAIAVLGSVFTFTGSFFHDLLVILFCDFILRRLGIEDPTASKIVPASNAPDRQ